MPFLALQSPAPSRVGLPRRNWSHPLTQGLIGWWLAHPAYVHGGIRWPSIADVAFPLDGKLTGMDQASETSGWHDPTRPGGLAEVRFNSSNSTSVVCGKPGLAGLAAFTIAAWIKPITGITASPGIYSEADNTKGPLFYADLTGTRLTIQLDATGTPVLRVAGAVTLDVWNHVVATVMTIDNAPTSLLVLSVNGRQVGSKTVGGTLNPATTVNGVIGGNQGGITFFHGAIETVMLYNRDLKATEVAALYAASQTYQALVQPQPRRLFPARPTLAPPPLTVKTTMVAPHLAVATRHLTPSPLIARGAIVAPHITGPQKIRPVPLVMRGTVVSPRLRGRNRLRPPALRLRGRIGTPTIHRQTMPAHLDPAVVAALAQEFIAGDWLIQAPALGLKLSYDYNPDGTWEHRVATISDPTISVPPGGGIASVGNVTVTVIENQQGQSLLELWQKVRTTLGASLTLDLLLQGQIAPIRIFTGRIDSLVTHDAITDITAVDDSLHFNPLIPQVLFTQDVFPNADASVLGQPIPLVYGRGTGTLPAQLPADIVVPAAAAPAASAFSPPPVSTPPDVLKLAVTYPNGDKTVLLTWTGQAYYGDTIDFYDVYAATATNQAGDCASVAYVATVVHPTQQYTLTIGNNAGVAVRVRAHSPTTGYGPLAPCVTFFGTNGYYLVALTTGTGATLNVPSCVTGDLLDVQAHVDVAFSGQASVLELHQDSAGGAVMDSQALHDFHNTSAQFIETGVLLQGVMAPPTGTQTFVLVIASGNATLNNATWVVAQYRLY